MATDYRTTALIEAPIATVWRILTDVERMPEWTPSMTSVRIVDGDGGGNGPEGHGGSGLVLGTRVEIRQPRMPAMTWTVDDLIPLQHFRWTARSAGVITHGYHWLSPGSNDQQVEARFEIRQTGPLAKLIGALTMRRTARYVDLEMQGLKQASEAAFVADQHR